MALQTPPREAADYDRVVTQLLADKEAKRRAFRAARDARTAAEVDDLLGNPPKNLAAIVSADAKAERALEEAEARADRAVALRDELRRASAVQALDALEAERADLRARWLVAVERQRERAQDLMAADAAIGSLEQQDDAAYEMQRRLGDDMGLRRYKRPVMIGGRVSASMLVGPVEQLSEALKTVRGQPDA